MFIGSSQVVCETYAGRQGCEIGRPAEFRGTRTLPSELVERNLFPPQIALLQCLLRFCKAQTFVLGTSQTDSIEPFSKLLG